MWRAPGLDPRFRTWPVSYLAYNFFSASRRSTRAIVGRVARRQPQPASPSRPAQGRDGAAARRHRLAVFAAPTPGAALKSFRASPLGGRAGGARPPLGPFIAVIEALDEMGRQAGGQIAGGLDRLP